jgi:serine/threonine-protein kinase
MNDRPVPPSQLVSNIPPGLEQIVMKAIEKYQINRFKTADDMYEALDNVDFVSGIIENPEVMEKLRERHEEVLKEGETDTGEMESDDVAANKGSGNKGKREKNTEKTGLWKIRILAIALALACALPASYFIYSALKDIGGQNLEEVQIPNVVGLSEEIAEQNLDELKLKLEVVDRILSEDVEDGIVVSQERPEGSKVKEGFTVRVNVSRGTSTDNSNDTQQPVEVAKTIPYLLGQQLEEALYTIEVYGYTTGDVSYRTDTGIKGSVIGQSPEAGTEADSGSRIALVISEGPPVVVTVAMPNLVGLTEDAARAALTDKGLSVGAVTADPSSTVEAGLVTSQQFAADVQVEQGSRVDFKVSGGSAATGSEAQGSPGELRTLSVPIDFTEAPTEVFALSVMLQDADGNLIRIINRENRYKSMESESVSITGTGSKCIVYVYFSDVRVLMFSVDFATGEVSKI